MKTRDMIVGYKVSGNEKVFKDFHDAAEAAEDGDHISFVIKKANRLEECHWCKKMINRAPDAWFCPYCGGR